MRLLLLRYGTDDTEADPTSYVNFYKRATAYLSLGKHSAALDDFDEILKLNPDFSQVSDAVPRMPPPRVPSSPCLS
jgi:tetratricopeptide (TPR) repeat protein